MNLARLSPARIGLTTRRNTIHDQHAGIGLQKEKVTKYYIRNSLCLNLFNLKIFKKIKFCVRLDVKEVCKTNLKLPNKDRVRDKYDKKTRAGVGSISMPASESSPLSQRVSAALEMSLGLLPPAQIKDKPQSENRQQSPQVAGVNKI